MIASLIQFAFGFLGISGTTLGFAQRAYRSIAVDLLMTRQTGLQTSQSGVRHSHDGLALTL